MYQPEPRPAQPAELDATARLPSDTELPVEDLDADMLDAFVVATKGKVCDRRR